MICEHNELGGIFDRLDPRKRIKAHAKKIRKAALALKRATDARHKRRLKALKAIKKAQVKANRPLVKLMPKSVRIIHDQVERGEQQKLKAASATLKNQSRQVDAIVRESGQKKRRLIDSLPPGARVSALAQKRKQDKVKQKINFFNTRSYRQFIDWLDRTNPALKKAVELKTAERLVPIAGTNPGLSTLNGIGAEATNTNTIPPEKTIWEKVTETVQELVPAYLQYDQQRKLMDLQLDRARAGLPPIESEQLAPTVKVGISSEIKKILIPTLAVGGALIAFKMLT